MLFGVIFFLCCQLASIPVAEAAQVVENFEDLKINWSKHRIWFLGSANREEKDQNFGDVEERALQQGLFLALEQVAKLYDSVYQKTPESQQFGQPSVAGQSAGNRVTSATYSRKNEYLATGGVRLHLGSSLANALLADHILFSESNLSHQASEVDVGTGVVFDCRGVCSPRPVYQVIDEQQKVVYRPSHVGRQFFAENLMGRWFKDPTPGEIRSYVGSNPIHVRVVGKESGVFRVANSDWKPLAGAGKQLLAQAKVVISVK